MSLTAGRCAIPKRLAAYRPLNSRTMRQEVGSGRIWLGGGARVELFSGIGKGGVRGVPGFDCR
jgi:hypothetical protein